MERFEKPPTNEVSDSTTAKIDKTRLILKRAGNNKHGVKECLQIFCFQNTSSSFILVVIVLILKLIMTMLYVVRVSKEDLNQCSYCGNSSNLDLGEVNWQAIIWVQRPLYIWAAEVAISFFTLVRMLIVTYLRFKGSCYKIITFNLCMETCMSLPLILTLSWDRLQQIYFPVFLNCWLAKRMLDQNVLSHKKMRSLSMFTQKVVDVATTLACLVFSGICAVQHLQRGSATNITLFETFYFVMVTLSTVGYGDISPDIWPSQLCVIILIVLAVIIIPKQVESLASTWVERQKLGGSYGNKGGADTKHIVFCTTTLTDDVLEEFLNEFYSHRNFQDFYVVFMSPTDLQPSARRILLSPLWLHRCMFILGSCVRDSDLERAGLKDAKALFLLGDGMQTLKSISDHHTILRSWAAKDYAPSVKQYLQIFRPENKVHVKFAKFAVCEDEFKYAMLAYNCLCPGTSTLLTLLMHTSKGEEGQQCTEPWLKLYGRCSGNEVYAIKLNESFIFSEYVSTNFSYASLNAHKRYNVILIGIQSNESPDSLQLNPGMNYILQPTDTCFYLSIQKEEDMRFDKMQAIKVRESPRYDRSISEMTKVEKLSNYYHEEQKMEFNGNFFDYKLTKVFVKNSQLQTLDDFRHDNPSVRWVQEIEQCEIKIGILPETPYIGMAKTLCHLRKEKKPVCCLALDQACKHSNSDKIKQFAWCNRSIILAAEKPIDGFFSFIVPLRAYYHSRKHLKPIVLLLENKPDINFLNIISWFPMVYYMIGNISNLNDVLRAGIHFADNMVIVTKEGGDNPNDEDDLSDSGIIIAVQTLKRYFPKVRFMTELVQSSNMRFMHFQANNEFATYVSEVEKLEKERGSTMSFMFRLQFAAGAVFSASMVDTMLYQGFAKEYLIPVVRRILGIIQTPGSGFLTSVVISKSESWAKTYGTMFTYFCTSSGDVPIGIYRTESIDRASPRSLTLNLIEDASSLTKMQEIIDSEITNLIKNRLTSLGLSANDYELSSNNNSDISYVIINPHFDLELENHDIIFVLRPSHAKMLRKNLSLK